MTVEQQRIIKLEQRLWEAEGQLSVCLKFIRKMTEERVEALSDQVMRTLPKGEA
jgi:hypothetical protein